MPPLLSSVKILVIILLKIKHGLDHTELKLILFSYSKIYNVCLERVSRVSALHAALENLQRSVRNLEKSVVVMEQSRLGEQRDMFGQPQNGNEASLGKVSTEIIAQRLDRAIEKVEGILLEEEAA